MANDKFRVIKSVNKTSSGKGSTTMNQIDETCLIINTGSNAGVYLGVNGGFGECVANYSQDEKVKANTSTGRIYLVGQDDASDGTIESTYKNASVYMQSGKMYATSGNINSSETALVTGAAVNTAINTALSSALQYCGTLANDSSVSAAATKAGKKKGDVYVASAIFKPSKTYINNWKDSSVEVGDLFIFDGSKFDIVNGENQVEKITHTLAWNTDVSIAKIDGTTITVKLPSNPNTDYQTTKAGHYTPSDKDSSVTATARGSVSWSGAVVTGVTKDSKGHITGVTTSTIPSNPNTDYNWGSQTNTISNLNSITNGKAIWGWINANTTNKPDGITSGGEVLSFTLNNGHSLQFASHYKGNGIYTRNRNADKVNTSEEWSKWKKLAFAEDIPTSLKNPNKLTLKVGNNTPIEYDGSSAKTVNIDFAHKQEFTIGANKYAKITGGGIFTAFISVGSTLGNARHMSCWSSYGSGQSMRTNIKHIINGTDIYIDESDTGPIIYIKGYSQQTVIHILCSLSSFTCEELSSLPANVSITNTNSNNYTLAVKSDIPTKLSQLTDDVVTGKYLPITGGPIRNNSVTIPLTLASSKEAYIGMCFVNKNNESGYLIYKGGSDYSVTDDGWTATYTLLHTGNYTNYCKDTKVTSAANHYEPSNNDSSKLTLNASSNTNATWGSTDLITGLTVKRDNRGHVVDVSISSIQLPSNPNTDYQTTKAGHYTPSDKDSSVTATARGSVSWSGAVVTGVTKDSKGHITGVTTSTIPSNPNIDTKVTVNTSTGTVYLVGQSGITNGTNSTLYKNSSVYMSNGSITAYSFFETSDERLKTFTDDIDIDLNKLSDLRKSYFTFNSDESNKSHIGISAQEVQKLYPEIVNTNEDGYLSVDYAKLSVIALKAVDVLYNQNKDFERRLKEIEDKLK